MMLDIISLLFAFGSFITRTVASSYPSLNNFSSRWLKSLFSHLKLFAWVQMVTFSYQKKEQQKRQVQMKLGL